MTLTELNEIKKIYKVIELAVDFINPSYNISRAKHLDNSRYIICTLTENGIPRNVKENEVARIRLQKPDRTYIYNDCDILEDGRVFITLTEQILAVEGNAICDIQLTNEETGIIYSTKNFIINIDKTAVNNSIIESSNEFDALNNLISTNKKLNEELEDNEKIRQDNENKRIENENIRKSNETNRENAENERNEEELIRISNENQRIENERIRKSNEIIRQDQEVDRQTNTSIAIANAETATKRANDATDDLQSKLDAHHFVLTEDKDVAGGVASLDSNTKVPIAELYEATTSSKGVTQLTDSVTSTSTTTAATPNSVKTVNDTLATEKNRAITAENNLDAKKVDKTTVASISNLGLVKSGTDISVDSLGNVSVNDNSHNHIVSNLSDLTATADELNVLDGITASTAELNYTKGLTGNIQTQLNAKAPLASPVLTGTPKAPTASAGTNTTQIATTAFVQTAVSNHNTSTVAHSDIRELISGLTTRLNTLADSDDNTLDQLSEIVSYIKSNRTLIENITTNKVNVLDIVDNLTSTAGNKPLSANQGKVLSDLISTLTTVVNTKVDGVKGNAESSYRTGNVNITPANIGLGNVPNVSTNNQTPTYTEASALAKLVSGEKLSTAFGKISKAVSDLISHIGDTIKHITNAERTNWTAAYTHSQSPHAPSNAEVNQNAFSNIIAGSTTISADSKTDTVTFAAGSNITLTPDAANDKITISSKDTVYTHPAYSAKSSGLYKVTVDSTGHVSTTATVTKSDITALGIPSSDTNTHYTSKNVVGSSTATSNTTAALTNGNVYLNSVENGAVTSSHKISGSGATTVTTDASGNIIISSTDTNTTYSVAGTALGLIKSGGDLTIADGVATVNDDSHNHIIANVDGLQSTLNGKLGASSVSVNSSNTSTYPYHRIAYSNVLTGAYNDVDGIFVIKSNYNDAGFGLIKISIRTNASSSNSTCSANWIVRKGFSVDAVQVGFKNTYGNTYADVYLKTGTYARTTVTLLSGLGGSGWTTCSSTEGNNSAQGSNVYKTVADGGTAIRGTDAYTSTIIAADTGYVKYASSAGNADTVDNKHASDFAPSTHTHSAATTSAAGLMSPSDKLKLDAITASADSVSFAQSLTSGTPIGTITINGTATTLYCQTNTNTDTKVTSITTNPTSATTYYPTWVTGANNGNVLINNGIRYLTMEGTTTTNGYGLLQLGNSTASGTAVNKYGAIRLYGTGSYYGQINQATGTTNVTHTLPTISGTILNTGTTSFTQSLTSGTTIGTLKINGTNYTLYAPTNTNTTYTAGTGISLSGTTFSNSGVRSVATGTSNGTISVNTNGTTANVAVKGLGSAAYTASTAYASANHTHSNYLEDPTKLITLMDSSVSIDGDLIAGSFFLPNSYGSLTYSDSEILLTLGDSTQTVYGALKMYGTTAYYTLFKPYNLSSNATKYLVGTSSATAVGSSTKPVYISSTGTVTASNSTVGSADTPIYLNAGIITSTGKSFSNYLPLSGGTLTGLLNVSSSSSNNMLVFGSGTITAKNKSTGAYDQPITIQAGGGLTIMSSGTQVMSVNTTNGITTDKNITCGGTLRVNGDGLELYYSTPYIDFHYGNATSDYTARIIEKSSGSLTVYNTISNASDRTLKKDIENLDKRYLDVLDKLIPSQYRFIKGGDYLNLGFIAQDVEKILLECGITDMPLVSKGEDGIYALDYNGIIPILVLGYQEQKKELQKQKQQIEYMENIITNFTDIETKN